MKIKKIAIGNTTEAFIEERITDGVNVIFSDDNNKGKTLVMQGMMYSMGNQPTFPKGFNSNDNFFYSMVEINNQRIEFLRRGTAIAVRVNNQNHYFDSITEFKYFLVESHIIDFPRIEKDKHSVIVDPTMFYEMFFIGQDKRNPSNLMKVGQNNKKDFISMLCSLNGYPLVEAEELDREYKQKIQQTKADIKTNQKMLTLLKKNPKIAGFVDKYGATEEFTKFSKKVDSLYNEIGSYKKARKLEYNRKAKLESLIHELNSLNREIEQGKVICAECGSDKIIYKNRELTFDVSNAHVRKQILSSIRNQINQKQELIDEYSYQIQEIQKELQTLLKEEPVEKREVLLYAELIGNESDYDDKLNSLYEQLKELEEKAERTRNVDLESRQKCIAMKKDIVKRMNSLYKEVDPNGSSYYDDIFTKRDETYSGSEEQEYYYSRVLALNDYFSHPYPLIIDCYRSGELSSKKEDTMIKNFITRNKQVILTSTLKTEEYSANKYDQYKPKVNVVDYSVNQSNKLLQERYVEQMRDIVESFSVRFE